MSELIDREARIADIRHRRERGTTPRPEDVDFLLSEHSALRIRCEAAEAFIATASVVDYERWQNALPATESAQPERKCTCEFSIFTCPIHPPPVVGDVVDAADGPVLYESAQPEEER